MCGTILYAVNLNGKYTPGCSISTAPGVLSKFIFFQSFNVGLLYSLHHSLGIPTQIAAELSKCLLPKSPSRYALSLLFGVLTQCLTMIIYVCLNNMMLPFANLVSSFRRIYDYPLSCIICFNYMYICSSLFLILLISSIACRGAINEYSITTVSFILLLICYTARPTWPFITLIPLTFVPIASNICADMFNCCDGILLLGNSPICDPPSCAFNTILSTGFPASVNLYICYIVTSKLLIRGSDFTALYKHDLSVHLDIRCNCIPYLLCVSLWIRKMCGIPTAVFLFCIFLIMTNSIMCNHFVILGPNIRLTAELGSPNHVWVSCCNKSNDYLCDSWSCLKPYCYFPFLFITLFAIQHMGNYNRVSMFEHICGVCFRY